MSSPALEVVLPEWSPVALRTIRERWATEWGHISIGPDFYITPGKDGMPEERLGHPEDQRWDLTPRSAPYHYSAPITIYVSRRPTIDSDFDRVVGWTSQGTLSARAWRSAPNAVANWEICATLAQDAAQALGGVVVLDTNQLPELMPRVGQLYYAEDWSYVDAELFGRIKDDIRY